MARAAQCENHLFQTFLYRNRSFAKTGSGQACLSGQAHGKLKKQLPPPTAAVAPSVGTLVLSHNQVGKRVCLRQCMLEIIILPRHARDKHTESTQKILRFGTLSHNQRLLGNALVQEDDLDKHINAQGLSPGCEICIF